MKTSRCRNCGEVFKNKYQKILHKKKYPNGCKNIEKEVDNKMGIFGKNKKGKSVAPPVEPIDNDLIEAEEEEEEEEDEDEVEEEVEVPEIEPKKKEVETTRAKRKPPIEEPVEEQEEELTEDKVKQILINFETRLQKIEYNLRIIP